MLVQNSTNDTAPSEVKPGYAGGPIKILIYLLLLILAAAAAWYLFGTKATADKGHANAKESPFVSPVKKPATAYIT